MSRAVSILGAGALALGLVTAAPVVATAAPARQQTAAAAAAGGNSAAKTYQTPEQASAQAVRTGKAVPVTGSTTATSTLTAQPDGSFTLSESAAPVRAKVGGAWKNLSAQLVENHDGTYSPAVSTDPLTLSGGGTAPLATMVDGSYSLALTAPMSLPRPEISGDSATYPNVLPGVNLTVTAHTSGGFSEVLEIENAAAAANPALKTLAFATRAKGLTLKAGQDGTIAALASDGATVFSAPAPDMWDSAGAGAGTSAAAKSADATKAGRAGTGEPLVSTDAAPGAAAHTAPLGVSVTGDHITLAPNLGLLTGAPGTGVAYPEFIDPTWDPAGSAASSWAYVSSDFSGQEYYDTSNYLQMGTNPDTGGTSYTYYTLPVPSQIYGATINSATLYVPEAWSKSCTATPVQLWQTGTISKSTTYGNRPGWTKELGSDDVAYNWWSGGQIGAGTDECPGGANDVAFNPSDASALTSLVGTAAADSWGNITFGLQDTGGGWMQFSDPATGSGDSGANSTMTINYANQPSAPKLSTSPVANCATGTSILGNGTVTLDASVYDKDGDSTGSLNANYTVYAAGTTADNIKTATLSAGSNTTAELQIAASTLQSAVSKYGSDDEVKVTFAVNVSDGLPGVPASTTSTCSFTYSTAVPGEPNIADSAGNSGCDTLAYTVGTSAGFTLEPNGTSTASTEPTSYTYQLNGGNPVTVSTNSAAKYDAGITVTPTRRTNILSFNAVAAGGNIGQANYCTINAAAPASAVDQDLTGDGVPDLLTVGNGTAGTASGLWLAGGRGDGGRFDGTVDTSATDIAPQGPQDVGVPASWNGLNAITGQFTDSGFNDIEAYQPGTDDVYVLPGQGDGSATTSDEQNLTGVLTDTSLVSNDTNDPLQLADAYNASGDDEPYPDQIGVFDDPNTSVGTYLAYFADSDGFNSFDAGNYEGLPYELTDTTPDGTMDWNDWTISTDNDTRAGTTYTDMYLWNQSTGALYLWELTGLTGQTTGGLNTTTLNDTNPTATLTYTATEISGDWSTTPLAAFQATDVNGDPGLTTVDGSGQVRSYAWNDSVLTQVNADTDAQSLITADHTYLLDDQTSGAVSTAADQPGAGDTAANLTGNSGTTWNSGDLFSPDVQFNGTSGFLVSPSGADDFTPNASYSISAWVDPSALGGTVFSQNGNSDSTVKVYSTPGGAWVVAINNSGTNSNSYVNTTGGTAKAGVWTDLTLTFDTGNGSDIAKLYANGVEIAVLEDTSPPTPAGRFLLGADQAGGVASGFLAGQLADVQVWDSLAVPAQATTANSVYVPVNPVRIMDTRNAALDDGTAGPVAASSTTSLRIDGNTTNSADLPASGITAVAVSVTVTGQTESGFLTVYPGDTPPPVTSNLNFAPNADTYTNNTIVPVGANGAIDIYNGSPGTMQLIVDLTGYFTTNTAATNASTYTPLASPARIVSKASIGAMTSVSETAAGITADGAVLPTSGITAIAVNLTAINAANQTGFMSGYADGAASPANGISNLSYHADADQAGTILIPVGADGKFDIYNNSASGITFDVDLSGYFTAGTGGQYYHPLDSTRIVDTRQTKALGAVSSLNIAVPTDVLADDPTLVVNLTATICAAGGYLTAYPAADALPGASSLNFGAGQTIPNLVLIGTQNNNSFDVYNSSTGTVDIVADTNGYFG
jgi:hypothetical protein